MERRGNTISLGQFCSESSLKSRKARNHIQHLLPVGFCRTAANSSEWKELFFLVAVFRGVFDRRSLFFLSPSLSDHSEDESLEAPANWTQNSIEGTGERRGAKRRKEPHQHDLSQSRDTPEKCRFTQPFAVLGWPNSHVFLSCKGLSLYIAMHTYL